MPAPNIGGVASGKFVSRVPETGHAATRDKSQG